MNCDEKTHEKPALAVEPLCPVFGECGGCLYQNLPYEEELKLKQELLLRLFSEQQVDLSEASIEEAVCSPQEYHYRHRLDIGIRRLKTGEYVMGFKPENKRRTIEIEACYIARKEVSDFIPELRRQAAAKLPENYRMANLVIRTGDDGRVLWGGIGKGSLTLPEEDYLWTEVNGTRVYYSMDTFFQANLAILPKLMDTIKDLGILKPETHFYDLYSGVGLFGLCLQQEVEKVFFVEECAASSRIARFNVKHHQLENKVEIYGERVESILPKLLAQSVSGHRVAMIDPPRKGLSPDVLDVLAGYATEPGLDALLYLSCSPESLSRDLKGLTFGGWRIRKVIPFDFFPKTQHLETLVYLIPKSDANA